MDVYFNVQNLQVMLKYLERGRRDEVGVNVLTLYFLK